MNNYTHNQALSTTESRGELIAKLRELLEDMSYIREVLGLQTKEKSTLFEAQFKMLRKQCDEIKDRLRMQKPYV